MSHISVVIPVYEAEDCLEELYNRLKVSLSKITDDFEIILVEDSSKDNSWSKINELAKLDARVKGIQFSRNFGQHYGITAGLDHVEGDWVVVMDCDLQDQPEEIPRLYNKAQEGYHIVLAKRKQRKDSFFKRITSSMFYKVFNYFTGLNYDGATNNFRIVSRKVVDSFCMMREQLRFFGGLMQFVGFSSESIQVEHGERFAGKSSYTYRKLISLACNTIIAYSDKPLRIAVAFGFFMSILSFLYGSYVIYRSLNHNIPIMGWSSLIVSLYFLGGLIIGLLGVIGVFLSKTFNQTKNRPLYIIQDQLNINRVTKDHNI